MSVLGRLLLVACLGACSCTTSGGPSEDPSDDPCDLSQPEPETWADECFGTNAVVGYASFDPIAATVYTQDHGGYGPEEVRLFFEGGLLTAVERQSCRYCNMGNGQPTPDRCLQSYQCGECWVSIRNDLVGELDITIREALEGSEGGTPDATCPYLGIFGGEECTGRCEGNECGPDMCGGSCGECGGEERCRFGTCEAPTTGGGGTNPACSECLADCRGLAGCCTGDGCLCESACLLTDCPEGQFFCCSAWGCICRTCPCYEWPCP